MSKVAIGKYNGEKNPNSKLDVKNVIKIKKMLKKGILKQTEIAKLFNVKPEAIYKIKTGRTWKNVKI